MNTLSMNNNLQSQQQKRRRQQSTKQIDSQGSIKTSDASASGNMLMQRRESCNVPVSVSVDRKSVSESISSKNIIMSETNTDVPRRAAAPKEEPRKIVIHPNDVLCGRGGSINAHEGNVVFRGWIQERRESYNLADTKSAKTRITNDIFRRVRSLKPPGRFLHKIETPQSRDNIHDDEECWAEVDDTKALAKISQALREGAPAFRAAHGKVRKSHRLSSRRRNSVPGLKKDENQPQKRSPKRRMTESPPIEAYQRSNVTADIDISPPYYNDDAAANTLDVDNYDSLFNHNQMQSYMNSPYLNAGYQPSSGYEGHAGIASDDVHSDRFDQPRPLNSHPLVNMCDYHASISDVANAIPPTPLTLKPRITSFSGMGPMPNLYGQVPASPYALQYEQFDPYSFLSPVPNTNTKSEASKSKTIKREYSLSFSDSELEEEIGDFTNPFEDNVVVMSDEKGAAAPKPTNHTTTIQMWQLPYTNDPFPSPHVTPPARGLSLDNIGSVPTGHFGSRKSSVTSSGERDETGSKYKHRDNTTTL